MKTICKLGLALMVMIGCVLTCPTTAEAQRGGSRGGGGGRPSMGSVGGGGGRSSGGRSPSAARPNVSRPTNVSRPSMANASRPSTGSRPSPAVRPSTPSRPTGGSYNPSGGGRPSLPQSPARPSSPAVTNRPSVRPPSNVNPVTRPSLPSGGVTGGNRPNVGTGSGIGGNRPGPGSDRPSLGNANRPTTLPGSVGRPGSGGNLPGGGNRPGVGGDRPGIGGNRPGGGGDRPGIGNRPGGGNDRPIIGGGSRPGQPNRPGNGNINIGNRPGGGNINIGNRPGGGNINIGNRPGGGNINIGNRPGVGNINIGNVNIGNRPGWDRPNWNNPGWGWGGGGWAGNWHNHCINRHHGWYNGCWNGYWGSNWYAPMAWGAVGWGLGSMTNGWGIGTAYYNPYVVAPESAATVPYDYSQSVVVNNYVSSDADSGDAPAQAVEQTPEADQAVKLFDEGLAQFKSGDYRAALRNFDTALQKLPGDPVVHEVRAQTLFALGEYQLSAAALNSFLSSAPGMDWTTMSRLYGNVADYEVQLRLLEQSCKTHPNDPAARFVLAYQYLTIGSKDAAVNALKVVLKNQPKDFTAKRMLEALSPTEQPSTPAPAATPDGSDALETDLVGNWRATSGDTAIELAITEDSQFTWKATPAGKKSVELKGNLSTTSDELVLESPGQGAMAGTVKSLGPDKWQFALSGAPSSDAGLSFARAKD